jgi:hypothetical protein
MGISPTKTFGLQLAGNTNGSKQSKTEDRPKAQFWMNVGYQVELETEEGLETRFVSTPTGIPLDTQEKLETNSRNSNFAAFQGARNDLLDQIMEVCNGLAPGEEKLITGLTIQVRRVNGDQPAINVESNPFRRKLSLVG